MEKTKIILVTGATGFIGENLIRKLVSPEHNITCMVRKTSNTDFLGTQDVNITFGDISCREDVDKVFSTVCPDIVFHCAAKVMGRDEKELYMTNVTGTENICKASRFYGVERVVYLSSIAVVNGNREDVISDDLPYKANNAYGRSKLEAEKIAVAERDKGLKISIIRPCMVYGEGEPHAIDRIFRYVIKRRIPVLDIPEMDSKLHLVSVDNVVDILITAMRDDNALEGTFIVADSDIITMRKFVKTVYAGLDAGNAPRIPGRIARVLMIFPPVRNAVRRVLKDRIYDISRAQKVLGYSPERGTEEALIRMAKNWREKNGEEF